VLRTLALVVPLVLPALAHAADPPKCVISGKSVTIQNMDVKPAGVDAFQLGVRGLPVTAELPARCGAPVTLHVGGALELTASRSDVWFRLTRDFTTPDGLITAKMGAQAIDVCLKGDRVFASLVLYASDVLEGEHKRPDELVRDVELPCDALTLDAVADDREEKPEPDTGEEEILHNWETRGEATRVVLRPSVGTRARGYTVEAASCGGSGCLNLVQVEAKKGWILAQMDGEGVTVRGWVPMYQLKRIPDDVGIGRSYGCYGDHGGGFVGGFGFANSVDREGTVRKGTLVYAEEARGAWGTFVAPAHVKVRMTPGASWAYLIVVDGFDEVSVFGVIPTDTITFDPPPKP